MLYTVKYWDKHPDEVVKGGWLLKQSPSYSAATLVKAEDVLKKKFDLMFRPDE